MDDPRTMCWLHLAGEHCECHMFAGTLRKGISVKGYIERGELDPRLLQQRHDELVEEMLRRGWNHHSPLTVPDYSYVVLPPYSTIDVAASRALRLSRCEKCRELENHSVSSYNILKA